MVKVVPRDQKDLETAARKGGLKLDTLTERDRYGYYYLERFLLL